LYTIFPQEKCKGFLDIWLFLSAFSMRRFLLHIYCYITSHLMLFSKSKLVVGLSAAEYVKVKAQQAWQKAFEPVAGFLDSSG
jgi:NADH:ubiquinone oxidoreductase subunit D